MSWYKAVREDLTSFHDPMFQYEIGKRVRPNGHRVDGVLCREGILHASPSPPEATRYNARWPWRIIEVAGTPATVSEGKAGFRQLTPVREVPVAESFGPNGIEVLRMVRRCETLTSVEAAELAAAWDAAWAAARAAAWDAARGAAGDAAWDAARGVVVRDLIAPDGFTQNHFDTLTGPWVETIGRTWEAT
jgi:hypothetical protein